jgi:exosome complex exonuclease DIS3/RRP44
MDFTKKDLTSDFITELKCSVPLYLPHIDPNSLLLEIKKGKYFMGRVQTSRFDINEATIKINGITNDIIVKGKTNMNRGLNMDTVAIEILDENEWIEKGLRSDAIVTDILEKEDVEDVKSDSDSEENEQILNIVEKINYSDKQPMGRIVGVVQGGANSKNQVYKTYAGSTITYNDLLAKDKQSLAHIDVANFEKNYRIFIPFDVRMEKIIIKSQRPEYLADKRIIVKVDGWDASLPFPYGHIVKIIGEKNDSKTESAVILHEFNIDTKPFSKKVINCLPQQGDEWSISEEEEAKRLDLRGLDICSIDPPGCKDIDDALH